MAWEDFGPAHWRERRRGRLPKRATRDPDWEQADLYTLARRDGWSCAYCGRALRSLDGYAGAANGMAATIDHVVPRAAGGGDTNYNAVLSCGPCNSQKRDQHPAVMFQ